MFLNKRKLNTSVWKPSPLLLRWGCQWSPAQTHPWALMLFLSNPLPWLTPEFLMCSSLKLLSPEVIGKNGFQIEFWLLLLGGFQWFHWPLRGQRRIWRAFTVSHSCNRFSSLPWWLTSFLLWRCNRAVRTVFTATSSRQVTGEGKKYLLSEECILLWYMTQVLPMKNSRDKNSHIWITAVQ